MSILEALIIGIVQGITEFLPVSSSGHILLLQRLFGIEYNLFTFSIVVHVGSLIPIFVVYFSRLKSLLFRPFQKLTWLLVLAMIPIVVVTVLIGDWVDTLFSGDFLAVGFILTAVSMLLVDRALAGSKIEEDLTPKDALIVGAAQVMAIVPGVSRSGSTIFGGMLVGLDRQSAANFSFLLAIPAILGGTVLEIFEFLGNDDELTDFLLTTPVVVGFFASMIAGFFAIKLMLKLIVDAKMKYFAYYLFVVAGLIVFDQLVTNFVF